MNRLIQAQATLLAILPALSANNNNIAEVKSLLDNEIFAIVDKIAEGNWDIEGDIIEAKEIADSINANAIFEPLLNKFYNLIDA